MKPIRKMEKLFFSSFNLFFVLIRVLEVSSKSKTKMLFWSLEGGCLFQPTELSPHSPFLIFFGPGGMELERKDTGSFSSQQAGMSPPIGPPEDGRYLAFLARPGRVTDGKGPHPYPQNWQVCLQRGRWPETWLSHAYLSALPRRAYSAPG